MLTYDMEKRGSCPLYEYLSRCIRADILGGVLPAHRHLPSKRMLAQQLSVSLITVENAYAQLLAEGYLYTKPRQGYYVADLGDLRTYSVPGRESSVSPEETVGHETGKLYEKAAEPENTGSDERMAGGAARQTYLADFSSNQTSPDSFPFSIWAKLSRRMLSDHQADLMRNPPAEGVYELRQAIAVQLKNFRGLEVSPNQIIIGAGTEFLYGLLIQLLGFDKIYASEDPGYAKPSAVFAAYGVRHVRLDIDAEGVSAVALRESGADIVHLTPAHHFPTGITMPAARRYELLRWAEEAKERYLIEDDYDSEFRMRGRPLLPLFGMHGSDHVIYMNTFTKTLSSTMRISYMVLPQTLLKRYAAKLAFYSSPVPTFEQYALAAFLRDGYFEKHVNRMRNEAKRRRDALLTQIKDSMLSRYCTIKEENAGLHFLLYLDEQVDPDIFETCLEQQGIKMRSIDRFYAEGSGQHPERRRCFVINYSSVPDGCIAEAVDRMEQAVMAALEEKRG